MTTHVALNVFRSFCDNVRGFGADFWQKLQKMHHSRVVKGIFIWI